MEEFDQLSLEEKFQVIFPILNEENWQDVLRRNDLNIQDCLYTLRLKNLSGYMETCLFCGDKKCEGCPVPLSRNMTLQDFIMKIGIENNISFYTEGYKRGKNDVIFEIIFFNLIVWNPKIEKQFFDAFQTAVSFPGQKQLSQPTTQKDESSAITLQDCFKEFEKPGYLYKGNMWYCNNCKEHVQAKKWQKLFRLPLVLIINLKRFVFLYQKARLYYQQEYIDCLVDFPLKGLDIQSQSIKGESNNEDYIYDLFCVSNNSGSHPDGQYSVYALNFNRIIFIQRFSNPLKLMICKKTQIKILTQMLLMRRIITNLIFFLVFIYQWYSLDGILCQKIDSSKVVTEQAQTLFYRRRGKVNLDQIDYEAIKQTATIQDLEQFLKFA